MTSRAHTACDAVKEALDDALDGLTDGEQQDVLEELAADVESRLEAMDAEPTEVDEGEGDEA